MGEGEFKVGDVVQLKSGGMPMTVTGAGTGGLSLFWQDVTGHPYAMHGVPSTAVRKATEDMVGNPLKT